MKSKRLKPRRIVVLGFLSVIALGTVLLMLPVSSATGEPIGFIDCLFTSTSAVCVTGLVSIDPGDYFSTFGQTVLAILIQIGGLGISVIGVIVFLAAGGKFGIGKQRLLKESLNLNSGKGMIYIIRTVAFITVSFELVGAILSYIVFSADFPAKKALGLSIFHSLAAFNNAGFDLLGGYKSLTDYSDNVLLCLTTSILIIFGGLGFYVIGEVISRKRWKSWSISTKVVLLMTPILLFAGTILFKLTEGKNITWLESFFQSVTSRTAGFATISMSEMTNAGLMVMMLLMFIGASPGSTGGGIKTTTFFVLIKRIAAVVGNGHCHAFKRKISDSSIIKAFYALALASGVVLISTFIVCILEPQFTFQQLLFEAISAFSTTGLSMGITPDLSEGSKFVLCLTMFIGRLGPLTIATMWINRELPAVRYSEEEVTIG